MASNLEIAGSVKRTQKGSADWYYGGDNEAWPDIATALANIPASIRPGKTTGVFIGGTITEYWWPTESVGDGDLIPKTPDLTSYATTAYVDSSMVAAIKLRGDWDISGGLYPATGGTGVAGAIKDGNAFRVSVAGVIGAQAFRVGDFIVALVDTPGQTAANWTTLDYNQQQATESTPGTAKIIAQSEIQNENSTNDTDIVTSKHFWDGMTRWAAIARTIIGDRIYNGLVNIANSMPELRFTTPDGQFARFVRRTDLSNNQFELRNNALQVGGIGKCNDYSGASQYISVPTTGLPANSTSDYTLSIWFKTSSTQTHNSLFEIVGGNYMSFVMEPDTNNVAVGAWGGSGQVFNMGANFVDGGWHNLIYGMASNGTFNIYVDNVFRYTGNTGNLGLANLAAGIINFGMSGVYGGSSYFAGSIDQAILYNTILTADDRTAIYNGGSGTASPPKSSNILRRYEFEEGTGTTTTDTNPNGTTYTATLENGVTWNNVGIVPVLGGAAEMVSAKLRDGLTNGERGIQGWGDFNGRNYQTGKWFQWFQNLYYILQSDNFGRWMFDRNNTSGSYQDFINDVGIAGNLGVGTKTVIAPANGLYVQGQSVFNDIFKVKNIYLPYIADKKTEWFTTAVAFTEKDFHVITPAVDTTYEFTGSLYGNGDGANNYAPQVSYTNAFDSAATTDQLAGYSGTNLLGTLFTNDPQTYTFLPYVFRAKAGTQVKVYMIPQGGGSVTEIGHVGINTKLVVIPD